MISHFFFVTEPCQNSRDDFNQLSNNLLSIVFGLRTMNSKGLSKCQPYRFDCWSAKFSLVSPFKHQFMTIENQIQSTSIHKLDPMSIVTRPLSLITYDDGQGVFFTTHKSQLYRTLARSLGLFSQLHMLQMEPLVDELHRPDCIAIMRKLIANTINNLKQNTSKEDEYVPKKSRRVKRKATAPADGDTWTEHVVIVNYDTKETRSYFKSKLSNRCVWDEPPSGASNIILFTERRPSRCEC